MKPLVDLDGVVVASADTTVDIIKTIDRVKPLSDLLGPEIVKYSPREIAVFAGMVMLFVADHTGISVEKLKMLVDVLHQIDTRPSSKIGAV